MSGPRVTLPKSTGCAFVFGFVEQKAAQLFKISGTPLLHEQ